MNPPYRIHFFDSVASTNDVAHEARYTEGDVIWADEQTRGRGQQGNSWASEAGKNVTFSLVLEPVFLPAGEQFELLRAVSLGIADALSAAGVEQVRIKWPNDIYAGDRKIVGILIENDILGANMARAIAGIGVNVNQTVFPAWVPNPTSIALQCGAETDRGEFLEEVCRAVMARYSSLARGETGALRGDYLKILYRLDQRAEYRLPGGEEFSGTIRGVGESGELIVERAERNIKTFLFKEIEYVL